MLVQSWLAESVSPQSFGWYRQPISSTDLSCLSVQSTTLFQHMLQEAITPQQIWVTQTDKVLAFQNLQGAPAKRGTRSMLTELDLPCTVGLDLNLPGPSQLQQSGLLLSGGHGSGHKRQRSTNDEDDPTGEPHQCKPACPTH